MPLHDNDRIELAKYLHGPEGQRLIAFMRASPPPPPIPVDVKMEVHHIQLCFGYTLGLDARLKQLIELAESKAAPKEPEPLRLHDTKSLS
jgi:hypothetical protein